MVGIAVADGLRRGVLPYTLELVSLVAGLALALGGYAPLAFGLEHFLSVQPEIARLGSFLALLILGHGAALVLLRSWAPLHVAANKLRLERVRQAGAVPAVLTALVISAVTLSAAVVLPAQQPRSLVLGSSLGTALSKSSAFVQPQLRGLLVSSTIAPATVVEKTENTGGDDFYHLRLPAGLRLALDSNAEARMLVLINAARAKAKLAPVRMDALLQVAARAHSRDMYQRAYFSHQTPDHKTPFDRIHAAGVRYVTAGENIAFAPGVDDAEQSLMDSPEHRANILNPDFRRVGIGVYRASDGYEEMFTQDYAD